MISGATLVNVGLRRRALRAAALCALAGGAALASARQPASEAGVKAAYLFRFLPYIEWPAGTTPAADAPLVVGVVGADAVHVELQAIVTGRSTAAHRVVVLQLEDDDVADGVHVLFVGAGARVTRWLERLRDAPVLVVADAQGALEAGAMLNFVAVDGRIRFEASLPAAERAGLRLGARLLAVAERVVTR